MKFKSALTRASLVLILGAFSMTGISSELSEGVVDEMVNPATTARNEAMLLVSLEDGTVIKQMISVDADICFKQSTNSATICLTEGNPVVDEASNTVIGFEMIEEHIDLIAKFE